MIWLTTFIEASEVKVVTEQEVDTAWAELVNMDASVREEKMRERYEDLSSVTEDVRKASFRAMARAEYSLADDLLRPFTISRMKTWLALDPEVARITASSYDAVMKEMPGTMAMRRVGMVQSLVNELSADEEDRLRQLVPGVFAGAPGKRSGLAVTGLATESQAPRAKKARLAFWRK